MKQKKKSILSKIIVLVLAALILIGTFISAVINAAEPDIIINSFTTGQLREAFEKAKGKIDQNSIKRVFVRGGTLSDNDMYLFQGLSSCEVVDLSAAELESGKIPQYLFSGRSALTTVRLPVNTEEIGNGAFSGCHLLTDVSMPSSVTKIGDMAFENCEALKEIIISKDIEELGDNVFRGCSSLEKVTFNSEKQPTMGDNAIPDGVKTSVKETEAVMATAALNDTEVTTSLKGTADTTISGIEKTIEFEMTTIKEETTSPLDVENQKTPLVSWIIIITVVTGLVAAFIVNKIKQKKMNGKKIGKK